MPALILIHSSGRGARRYRRPASPAQSNFTIRLHPRPPLEFDDAMAEERVRQRLRDLGVFL